MQSGLTDRDAYLFGESQLMSPDLPEWLISIDVKKSQKRSSRPASI